MNITYEYLDNRSLKEIHDCLAESFADYLLDMSYLTLEAFRHRNVLGRVDYNYSVGAFDGDKMIGLLVVAVDEIDGVLYAFDAGTGIVKDYRGQGLAGGMFNHSLARLKEKGIEYFMLEVLQENEAAIRAYKKENFEIRREFNCYDLIPKDLKNTISNVEGIEVKAISGNELRNCWDYLDYEVSWEHMLPGILAKEKELIIDGAFVDDECVGFVVYSPALCWVMAIAVKEDFQQFDEIVNLLITQLMNKIEPIRPFISCNNLQPGNRLEPVLVNMGFILFTKQYEMISKL